MEIIWSIAKVMWGIICLALLAGVIVVLGWIVFSTYEAWQDGRTSAEYERKVRHCMNTYDYGTREYFDCFPDLPE